MSALCTTWILCIDYYMWMGPEDNTAVAGLSSYGGLYIGTGKDLDAASFFSGLIDDVRIYRRALRAEDIAALEQ